MATKIERDLAGVQGAAGPSHRAVGARRIRNLSKSGVTDVADEDGHIRSVGSSSVERGLDEHVPVGEVPSVAAGKFETEKNFIPSVEEVGTEIAAAFNERAKPATSFFSLG